MRKRVMSLLSAFAFSLSVSAQDICINEFVVDPQQDHNTNGYITEIDEYFELFNRSFTESHSLIGWRFELIDTTPTNMTLGNIVIAPREFYVIQNAPGQQNNNGQVLIYDAENNLVDSVTYGNWEGTTLTNGNAHGLFDESLSRFPDGSTNWVKTFSTRGKTNSLSLEALLLKLNITKTPVGIRVDLDRLPEVRYILQKTEDFVNWNDVVTNSAGTPLDFETINGNIHQFYRLRGE